MESRNFFKLLALVFEFILSVNCYSSRFYENTFEYEYDCSVQFDPPLNFDCACISGLWKLFGTGSDCMELLTIGGDKQHCFTLPGIGVTRAELLLPDRNQFSIKRSDASIDYFTGDHNGPISMGPMDTLIAGMEWTLEDEVGTKVCLGTEKDSYCFFDGIHLGFKSTAVKIQRGCQENIKSVFPSSCKNINYESDDLCGHRIGKRDVRKKGRIFLGSPALNRSYVIDIAKIYDEDYFINTTTSYNSSHTSNAVASGLWNYMDSKLDQILGLKEPEEKEQEEAVKIEDTVKASGRAVSKRRQTGRRVSSRGKRAAKIPKHSKKGRNLEGSAVQVSRGNVTLTPKQYRLPVYQFLELAKQVMTKTCPSAYVNPDFFSMAVTTFIKIQKRHFRFPEGAMSYHGYLRISDSLKECIANVSVFNFTTDPCISREKQVTGSYCGFGSCANELNVIGGFEDFDPIIETVWNVFKNAHSACFNYFNKNYNDHHRFTTWMMPLFQNQINEIWQLGTAKVGVYGGMFGNQENVQTAIAYCTASSQLQSKYPWDLPRPGKVVELSSLRKKRQVFQAQCLTPENMPKCV